METELDFGRHRQKARSVDHFSRFRTRGGSCEPRPADASQFRRRAAARGSCSSLHSEGLLSAYRNESECSLHYKADNLYHDEPSQADPLVLSSHHPISDRERRPASYQFTLPRISLAKLSIVFLALATVTDVALTQMSDADRPRASLGSAAISSVTETLSPILPFAGGLDLRRDDYWSTTEDGNWFGTLSSVVSQVQDAFASRLDYEDDDDVLTEGNGNNNNNVSRSTVSSNSNNNNKRRNKKKKTTNHVSAISKQQPFVTVEAIAELTLGEVAQAFRYAVDSSNPDFNYHKFASKLQPRVQKVIKGMQEAVQLSRGKDVVDWVRQPDNEADANEIDALKFAAAMRIFGEWRMLRLVPDGYKGFAVGMSLGHKDVVQNIVKMEEAVHGWLDYERDLPVRCVDYGLRTPTLRELLSFEIETGIQDVHRLPRLKEKSAGMGLLWVRRQFAYQSQLFDNVMVTGRFASTKDAVMAAYAQVYNRYHGWAVQKIFNYSFQSAPDAEFIFRHMNPHRLQELLSEQRSTPSKDATSSLEKDSNQSSNGSSNNKKSNPLEQFLNGVGGEWDKLVAKVLKKDKKKNSSALTVRGGDSASSTAATNSPDDDYVTQKMVEDAQQQIASYLHIAQPLLGNLAELFDDLNMDDPTKV